MGSLAGVQRGGADHLSLQNGVKGQFKGLSARGPKGQPRPPPFVFLLWGWAQWTGGPEVLSPSPFGVRWPLGEDTQLSPLTPGQGIMTTPPASEGPQVTGQGLPGATGDFQQTSGWGPSEWPNGSSGGSLHLALLLRGWEIVASHFTDAKVSVHPGPGKGCGPRGS